MAQKNPTLMTDVENKHTSSTSVGSPAAQSQIFTKIVSYKNELWVIRGK